MAATISWRFEGLQSVQDDVQRYLDALEPDELNPIMGEGADVLVDSVRAYAKGEKEPTGTLAASVGKRQLADQIGWSINPFVNNGDQVYLYAATQETGQEHVPRERPAMQFEWEGSFWITTHVTIPGMHYMEKGFADGADGAVEAVKSAFNQRVNSD